MEDLTMKMMEMKKYLRNAIYNYVTHDLLLMSYTEAEIIEAKRFGWLEYKVVNNEPAWIINHKNLDCPVMKFTPFEVKQILAEFIDNSQDIQSLCLDDENDRNSLKQFMTGSFYA